MHISLGAISLLQICISTLVLADQYQTPLGSDSSNVIQPHRVAIIGAGAAGSSAAYHLAQYADVSSCDTPVEITIFDVNSRVGGRTTTINALNDSRYPTEVGGSIFVKINHILYNATRDFGLDTKDRLSYSTGSAYDLGIWDGSEFVFQVANDDDDASSKGRWKGWWDIAKLLWRYGLSPIKTQRVTKSAISQFLRLYDDYFPFQSLNDVVTETGLTDYTGASGTETLVAAGVSEKFSREIIQASTRVNYAQNLGSIHGLETLVCMAIEGAMAVEGGNWQIFDQAVKRSKATLHLETAVETVTKDENNHYHISTNTSSSSSDKPYDTVILAAPYQFANVTFNPPLTTQPERIDYVSLHVTLFTSPHRPSPQFFNLNSQNQVPDSILTTLPPGLNKGNSRGESATGPTNFWSLSTLRVLEPEIDPYPPTLTEDEELISLSQSQNRRTIGRQYLYKIFSPNPISASFLESLFNLNTSSSTSSNSHPDSFTPISTLPQKDITWSYTRHWHSYPYLTPRTSFDPFKLDEGVYYTSAMESFISTMETSALAGKNVARLIWDEISLRREGKGGCEMEGEVKG